jgi:NAD-dependent DNA ligase
MPAKCPICGTEVIRTEGEVDYRCVNVNCPAKLRESILHFASRHVMNIEGMGDALVNQLTDRGMVKKCLRYLPHYERRFAQPRAYGREVRAKCS